jgi:hypothetical protein
LIHGEISGWREAFDLEQQPRLSRQRLECARFIAAFASPGQSAATVLTVFLKAVLKHTPAALRRLLRF